MESTNHVSPFPARNLNKIKTKMARNSYHLRMYVQLYYGIIISINKGLYIAVGNDRRTARSGRRDWRFSGRLPPSHRGDAGARVMQ